MFTTSRLGFTKLAVITVTAHRVTRHVATMTEAELSQPVRRCTPLRLGAGIAEWLDRRTLDQKVPGSSPGFSFLFLNYYRVSFLLQNQLSG